MLAARIAAAARRLGETLHSHGPAEVARRVAARGYAFLRRARTRQDVRRARARALAMRPLTEAPAEACEVASASVRVIAHASEDGLRTAATLRALGALHERTAFSFETVREEVPRSDAIATVTARMREPFFAYLPAGVVPLPGWLDTAAEALEAFDADCVAANFGDRIGVARTVEVLSIDGALQRRVLRSPPRLVFAPEARAVDTRGPRRDADGAPALRGRSAVVIDEHVPMPDRDGGSARMREILAMLRANGWDVALVPADGRAIEPYAASLQRCGIEVLTAGATVAEHLKNAEVIWIARPGPAQRYLESARRANPRARIVYDTVDLHHVRERRRGELFADEADAAATREREGAAIRAADVTVVVSEVERAEADVLGARETVVVPTMQRPIADPPAFAAREGLLFVGSFDHEPNVDAALYLVREIVPLLGETLPLRITIVGNNPPPRVRALASDLVDVRGYVPDLGPLLRGARLALAPLRFGAGLKAKITQALGYGLPIVCTSVAAEGFTSEARAAMAIADDPADFAQAILETYGSQARWDDLAHAAHIAAKRYSPSAVLPAVLGAVGSHLERTE